MKAERLVWQDSTCSTLNSQRWNNDGISQGNTRGSKGFLWLWKRMAAQGAVTSFLFRVGLLCLLFICGLVLWGLRFYCPQWLRAPSSGQWQVCRGWCFWGKQSLLCSEPVQQCELSSSCGSCCVWWQSDCTVGHGVLVSASPPGVPQSLSVVCYLEHWLFSCWFCCLCSRSVRDLLEWRDAGEQGEYPTVWKWNKCRGDWNDSKDWDLEKQEETWKQCTAKEMGKI